MPLDEDPGWHITAKSLMGVLLPGFAMRRAARSHNPLSALRSVFLSFCGSLVLIGIVVALLGDVHEGKDSPATALGLVGGWGVLTLVGRKLSDRPLACSSASALAASYRTRFFLRVAVAEAAALFGFVVSMVLGPWWVFYVGAVFGAIGLAWLAPTRSRLAREGDQLSLDGCQFSLVAALLGASPAS